LRRQHDAPAAVADLVRCVFPDLADDLGQLARKFPSATVLQHGRPRLDITCMLLRQRQAEQYFQNQVHANARVVG
jgi:hypothetical protein